MTHWRILVLKSARLDSERPAYQAAGHFGKQKFRWQRVRLCITGYCKERKAGLTRLELATSCVTGRRSNQTELRPQVCRFDNLVGLRLERAILLCFAPFRANAGWDLIARPLRHLTGHENCPNSSLLSVAETTPMQQSQTLRSGTA